MVPSIHVVSGDLLKSVEPVPDLFHLGTGAIPGFT
jgi:hypothetical protein